MSSTDFSKLLLLLLYTHTFEIMHGIQEFLHIFYKMHGNGYCTLKTTVSRKVNFISWIPWMLHHFTIDVSYLARSTQPTNFFYGYVSLSYTFKALLLSFDPSPSQSASLFLPYTHTRFVVRCVSTSFCFLFHGLLLTMYIHWYLKHFKQQKISKPLYTNISWNYTKYFVVYKYNKIVINHIKR